MYYINIIYTKDGLLENRDERVCVGRMNKGGDVNVNKPSVSKCEQGSSKRWVNKPSTARKLRWRAPRALQGLRLLFGAREGWCVHEKPSVARKARQRVGAGTATLSRTFRATEGWCGGDRAIRCSKIEVEGLHWQNA